MTVTDFESAYQEYRTMPYWVIRDLGWSHEDAEDLAQQVWANLWNGRMMRSTGLGSGWAIFVDDMVKIRLRLQGRTA